MIEKIALKFLERSELLRKIVKKAKNEAVKEKLSSEEAIKLAIKIKKSKKI